MNRLDDAFFQRDVLDLAPLLLGKTIVRKFADNTEERFLITETEAYKGEEDLACHASKGRTPRTEVMYQPGGCLYVYLIYGMYWMLNIVTGQKDNPQAVLIRGLDSVYGPGRLTKKLQIDKSFNGERLLTSERIYLLDNGLNCEYTSAPRVGIDYAGEYWRDVPWRFTLKP
jgi:DNA-3-methyladenine glycosylase